MELEKIAPRISAYFDLYERRQEAKTQQGVEKRVQQQMQAQAYVPHDAPGVIPEDAKLNYTRREDQFASGTFKEMAGRGMRKKHQLNRS